MNGPVPIGFSAKALAFSASVAPAAASNSFCGMIAVLKTVSADRKVGSGCLRVMTIVLAPSAATEAIEATRNCQMPLSGRGAVERPLHVVGGHRRTVGELDAVAQRQRHRLAVVRHLPLGGEARLQPLAVVGGQDQRVVEVRQDPDVDIGVVQHRVKEQAVGDAGAGRQAALRAGQDGRSGRQAPPGPQAGAAQPGGPLPSQPHARGKIHPGAQETCPVTAQQNLSSEVEQAWANPIKRELLPVPNPYARSNSVHTSPSRQVTSTKPASHSAWTRSSMKDCP